MPKVRRTITDLDRRRFVREVFSTMLVKFRESLEELKRRHADLEFEIVPVDATKFTAEVFLEGESRARCKIWIGGLVGGVNDIAYADGNASLSSNTLNENLSLNDERGELAFHALMGTLGGRAADDLDLKRLSMDEAVEYLWRRFSSELER